MKRSITRTHGSAYCTVTIEIRDGRLSITGEAGEVMRRSVAKKQALEYWASYFDECPEERRAMAEKFGRTFRTAMGAARFVVATDGEFHGLDVSRDDGAKVYVGHSWGQITDEISDYFPEVRPLLPWHLNDMRAGCEHQEELGWGHGKDVTIMCVNGWGQMSEKTYKDSLGAPCSTCGYAYGSKWLKRDLPPEIVALASSVLASEETCAA